jgi:hypothetical protein
MPGLCDCGGALVWPANRGGVQAHVVRWQANPSHDRRSEPLATLLG